MPKRHEATPSPSRTPRSAAIELLQVFSLLAFAAAWALYLAGAAPPFLVAAIVLGVILFCVPFHPWFLRVPEPPARPHGFKITRERRRTLAELSVPVDILLAIDETILDVQYQTRDELREALNSVIGEARLSTWSETILLHAKVHGGPPELTAGEAATGKPPHPGPAAPEADPAQPDGHRAPAPPAPLTVARRAKAREDGRHAGALS